MKEIPNKKQYIKEDDIFCGKNLFCGFKNNDEEEEGY